MPSSARPTPRNRWVLLALALALVLPGQVASRAGATTEAGPVANSLQQVYHPGTEVTPSTPITDYTGELLALQASNVGMGAAEPTIGVTKDGTAFFAAGELVVDTALTWGGIQTDTLRSTDGGLTWKSVQAKIPGTNEAAPPANADPFVWVDQTTDRVFNLDLYAGCSWLNYSDTKGDLWKANPAACGNFVNDHQTIGAGKPPANLTTRGYPNVLYYCFNRLIDSNCGRSLDGGDTWGPTPQPAFLGVDPVGDLCGGLHGHIETDPDGRLFMPKGHCGNPWIAISENGGDTWKRVKVSNMKVAQPHLSVGSDSAGNLYFVWWDADKRLPYMAISRDHGATWGTPMMIAPPGVTEVNFPVVAAGDPGHVAVSFPSSTSPTRAGTKRPWNQHMVITTNALDANPTFLSATANDPADPIHRGNCNGRCAGLWDFQDLIISAAGEAWASASDDCVATCVTPGDAKALHNGQGIAIRQIGGPVLRTPPAP